MTNKRKRVLERAATQEELDGYFANYSGHPSNVAHERNELSRGTAKALYRLFDDGTSEVAVPSYLDLRGFQYNALDTQLGKGKS